MNTFGMSFQVDAVAVWVTCKGYMVMGGGVGSRNDAYKGEVWKWY